MKDQIYQQQWIHLPKETRLHLIKVFSLERTGITEIRDQEVLSDGFTNDDLKRITLEKMCEYIGSQETFARAWEITLAKVHSELNPIVGEIGLDPDSGFVRITPVREVLQEMKEVAEEVIAEVEEKIAEEVKSKPWCDTCASKGVRHKKGCPKYVEIIRESNPFRDALK